MKLKSQFAWVLFACSAAIGHTVAQDQVIVLDPPTRQDVFEGVGAVSGGGATSVLLKDYAEPYRSQILDILFKPKFAASMQTLYVEVGGDGNSTQGTEPSHMRSRSDENYHRGYEWWLMREAKQRNPALTLDACAWSVPAWVGEGNFWSQDTADYYVKWIKGLKTQHNLDLDAVGTRNERGSVPPWVKVFRKTLNANGLESVRIHAFDNPGNERMWDWIPELAKDAELADSVAIASNHTLTLAPKSPETVAAIRKAGKPIWNTEEHVYHGEGRKYHDEFACALAAVHLFNDNYISHGATKIVNWYLAGSTYAIEPYADQPPAMVARSPWSGHYRVKPIIWAYAHYGQFTEIGWKYLPSGCLPLSKGGTMVALKSDQGELSIIAETAGARSPQLVTIKLGENANSSTLCVWRTTLEAQFIRQDDVKVGDDAAIRLQLDPDAIYSISTTTGQQKGSFAEVPQAVPFPFPYFETFDGYGDPKQWGYLPRYTADICGVFEIAERPDKQGRCVRQVVTQKTNSWAPEWMPYTVIGDENWSDYEISADIFFDNGGWAGVMGRVSNTGNGWDGNPNGYYARLYPDGGCAIYLASAQIRGARERQLAVGTVPDWKGHRWHNLKLRFEERKITVLVDGKPVASCDDNEYRSGMAGLITAGEGNARHSAMFDNLWIAPVGSTAPPPPDTAKQSQPLYPVTR